MVFAQMEPLAVDILDVIAFVRVAKTGAFAAPRSGWGISKIDPQPPRRARWRSGSARRLLTRTAQGASPTEIGRTYYGRASNIWPNSRPRRKWWRTR
jgi:hypothetical protein